MKAEIITIGDEILIGQVINSNAAWIAEQLHRAGVDVVRMETVADRRDEIRKSIERAWEEAELVITTGGLGPTHDDITRESLAEAFGVQLRLREDARRMVVRWYQERGRGNALPPTVDVLAAVPEGFEVLPNRIGTAPGYYKLEKNRTQARIFAAMPGVPAEMEVMLREELLPLIKQHRDLYHVRSRVLLTTGIGETSLQETIFDIVPEDDNDRLWLAYLPSAGSVRLRLTAAGDDPADINAALDRLESALRERLGDHIYGAGDDLLEAAVGRLLRAKGLTIAAAESCTGGAVANRISDISGSSSYFFGGIVAYSNNVKMHALGVDAAALDDDGAVSQTVALQMARGVRERLGADIGVSTTGIAGPTGGTPEKPVGTVWIAYTGPDGEQAVLLHLGHHRGLNKELTATAVLDLVRRRIISMKG